MYEEKRSGCSGEKYSSSNENRNIFFYFVLFPTNAQLFHKLSHSYMFRNYHVILRELIINLHLKYMCNLENYWLQAPWGWHDNVETCRSVIICEIIVHLLVIVQNNKRCTVQGIKTIETQFSSYIASNLVTVFNMLSHISLFPCFTNSSMSAIHTCFLYCLTERNHMILTIWRLTATLVVVPHR
jgi:hypothetical protein